MHRRRTLKDILQGASSAELEALRDQIDTDRLLQTSHGKDWLAQGMGAETANSSPRAARKRRTQADKD
jgi:hypothetical protein